MFCAVLSCHLPSLSIAGCRQALALGLDVSGSVDLHEYRLQLDGLVAALNDPEITATLLVEPQAPVSIFIYEWSGSDDQSVLVPWTAITSRTILDQISTALAQTERRPASPSTALGVAMEFGVRALAERPECWKHTLDISGDGTSNFGIRPRDLKDWVFDRNVTVNALVIGADAPASGDQRQSDISELSSYFRAEVIVGEDAFVQTALGFEGYAEAMTLKLKKELEAIAIGALQ